MKYWENEIYKKMLEEMRVTYFISIVIIFVAVVSYVNVEMERNFSHIVFLFFFLILVMWYLGEKILRIPKSFVQLKARLSNSENVFLLILVSILIWVFYTTGFCESRFKSLFLVPVVLSSLIYGRRISMAVAGALGLFLTAADFFYIDAVPNKMLESDIVNAGIFLMTAWLLGGMVDRYKEIAYRLRSERNYMRYLLDNLPVAVFTYNENGELDYTNKAAVKLTGFALDKPSGDTAKNVLNGDIAGGKLQSPCGKRNWAVSDIVKKVLDKGKPVLNVQSVLLPKNEKEIRVSTSAYPIETSASEKHGVLCVVRDLTAELEYEELKQTAQFIFNAINSGVVAVDESGKISILNPAAERILKVKKEEVVGKFLDELLKVSTLCDRRIISCLLDGKELKNEEVVDKEGKSLLVDVGGLINPSGVEVGSVMVIKDITEKKEALESLKRAGALAAVGEMAASTAHEIKNPLTSMKGFLQLLKEKSENEGHQDIREYVDIILEEIDHVIVIVNRSLMLARPSEFKKEKVELNKILDDIYMLLESEAARKGVTIKRIKGDGPITVWADIKELKQVFLNIAINGIQEMNTGGVLTISSYFGEDGTARVQLTDTGKGIPAEIVDKVFNPFFTTKKEGTGLGLAISSRIISDHGGKIEIDSRVGEGTRVTVCLPCENIDEP